MASSFSLSLLGFFYDVVIIHCAVVRVTLYWEMF